MIFFKKIIRFFRENKKKQREIDERFDAIEEKMLQRMNKKEKIALDSLPHTTP